MLHSPLVRRAWAVLDTPGPRGSGCLCSLDCLVDPPDDEAGVRKVSAHHPERLESGAPKFIVPTEVVAMSRATTVLRTVELPDDGKLFAEQVRPTNESPVLVGNRPVALRPGKAGIKTPDQPEPRLHRRQATVIRQRQRFPYPAHPRPTPTVLHVLAETEPVDDSSGQGEVKNRHGLAKACRPTRSVEGRPVRGADPDPVRHPSIALRKSFPVHDEARRRAEAHPGRHDQRHWLSPAVAPRQAEQTQRSPAGHRTRRRKSSCSFDDALLDGAGVDGSRDVQPRRGSTPVRTRCHALGRPRPTGRIYGDREYEIHRPTVLNPCRISRLLHRDPQRHPSVVLLWQPTGFHMSVTGR